MGRNNKTLRLDDDVDEYLDEKSDEWGVFQSDIVNRAVKVYAAKIAKGQWNDPKFQDKIDEAIEDL